VDLSLGEQITAALVLMLTSKGMAGVPGSSFLALPATVAAIGHGPIPVAAVALLLGVDRVMDSMRVAPMEDADNAAPSDMAGQDAIYK
jgi:aerobic C4-dicarboxylate transport protein